MEPDKRAPFVVGADFVTTTDGTGIVHMAPAFGEDDMRVGLENDLPVVNAVDLEGRFVAEVTPWAGVFVKDADPAIIAELKARGLLLGVEPYEHSYPFCWRCDTALLYYAKATWYIRTTAIKDELIKANDDVIWHPEHIKTGRFGEWLAGNVDWALGRDRYWGTPLPVWCCEEGHTHLSLIHISEPTRLLSISYAVFCLKKKKKHTKKQQTKNKRQKKKKKNQKKNKKT